MRTPGEGGQGVRKGSDDVRLLVSIGGVDFYLAALYSSVAGDVNSYPDDGHLASYMGIIPA